MTRPSQRALDLATFGLEELKGQLRKGPPAGTSPDDVDGVFARHKAPLIGRLAELLDAADSTIGSPNAQGFWPTITVGEGEAPPDYLLLLQAEPDPAFNPTVQILPQWVPVENLDDAQRRVANFIDVNKVGEGNWKGGKVTRDGESFAQIRYDGRIFNSLIGGEIDSQGNPIERHDWSLALVRSGGRSLGYSDGPKVAGALSAGAVKGGQKP